MFHVVNGGRLQRLALLFTTSNLRDDRCAALADWDWSEAILDRVLERGRIAASGGPSMRTRHLQGTYYER